MALTARSKRILEVGLADKKAALEISTAIDSGSNPQAAAVAAIPASADLTALVPVAATIADSAIGAIDPANPTEAEIEAGIDALRDDVATLLDDKADNADVETLRGEVEGRLDALEAKVNAVIASLKTAGLMLS